MIEDGQSYKIHVTQADIDYANENNRIMVDAVKNAILRELEADHVYIEFPNGKVHMIFERDGGESNVFFRAKLPPHARLFSLKFPVAWEINPISFEMTVHEADSHEGAIKAMMTYSIGKKFGRFVTGNPPFEYKEYTKPYEITNEPMRVGDGLIGFDIFMDAINRSSGLDIGKLDQFFDGLSEIIDGKGSDSFSKEKTLGDVLGDKLMSIESDLKGFDYRHINFDTLFNEQGVFSSEKKQELLPNISLGKAINVSVIYFDGYCFFCGKRTKVKHWLVDLVNLLCCEKCEKGE